MSRPRSAALLYLLALLLGTAAHAQGLSSSTLPADFKERFYTSQDANPFAIPSGVINAGSFSPTTPFSSQYPAPSPEDIENLQGCGGVGQSDYTSALFNMPEVFQKFQRDVDTDLARQILTYNYSLPQTAALFDTLNAYGNARYQQFQQACKLDSLKQDAKNQYMAACVKELLPERTQLVEQALQNMQQQQQQTSGNGLKAPNPVQKEDLVKSQAYAQAWELCALQYSNDSKAIAQRRTSNETFIKAMREVENVNKALRPLLCQAQNQSIENNSSTVPDTCWATLLLPQVRLCNGTDLSGGCTPAGDYGVREAPISIGGYFDLLRTLMEGGIVPKLAESLQQSIEEKRIQPSMEEKAANVVALSLSRQGFNTTTTPSDPGIKEFQHNYLNCKSSDINYILNRYREAINGQDPSIAQEDQDKTINGGPNTVPTNVRFTSDDYKAVINNKLQNLGTGTEADRAGLTLLTEVALGCTANQIIPIFDPNITANLSVRCDATDRAAFYTMASYDVALATTRDIYRFLSLRLKQVYARLLNEPGAGFADLNSNNPTGDAADTNPNGAAPSPTTPFDSPQLRQRLADAVKEVMIPAVESQLARLEELEKARGQFAQRVQKIYQEKQGCVYNAAIRNLDD